MTALNSIHDHPARPIRFRDFLPEIVRGDDADPPSFQDQFLQAFEDVFEELQGILEGVQEGDLQLIVRGVSVQVSPPKFPQSCRVTAGADRFAKLSRGLPANLTELNVIEVDNVEFARSLVPGDNLDVHEESGASLRLVVLSVSDAQIIVEPFQGFAVGTPVSRFDKPEAKAMLIRELPTNLSEITNFEIDDPQFVANCSIGSTLQVSRDNPIALSVLVRAIDIIVDKPEGTPETFPVGTFVSVHDLPSADTTTLAKEFPARVDNEIDLTHIQVSDPDFFAGLKHDSKLVLHAGGVADLFNPDLTPPPQFARRIGLKSFPTTAIRLPDVYQPDPDSAFLNFLASWIGLPLRDDLIARAGEADVNGQPRPDDPTYSRRKARWNRHLLRTAVGIYPRRGTLAGLEGMLRAWLKDDLAESGLVVTDLLRRHTDVDAVFQLGVRATLGVDTVLGEGAPFFFIVDLTVDPSVRGLRKPVGIDVFIREARFILDTEAPVHTYYELRVRATTMQLTPPLESQVAGEIYAQVGETTMLWDEPSIFRIASEVSRN